MTFDELNLSTPLLNALNDQGIVTPTTIQKKAFSVIMSGKDVVGIAQTGTGKTLAYLLPCLRQWKYSKAKVPQVLIIVPTRELVKQVVGEVEKLTTYINVDTVGVYGGTNMKTQIKQVLQGVDIIVGTPGRLFDLTVHGSLKLKSIKKLVIDEVDEMLNLGFRSQLISLFELVSVKKQTLMFSATLTEPVEEMINEFFNNPEKVEAAPSGTPLKEITQVSYAVPNFHTKVNLLKHLLSTQEGFDKVLIFAATKKLADLIYNEIFEYFEEEIGVIHSNKSQNNRFNTVEKFYEGKTRILIATDIVARGVDITGVTHVFNFDMPEVPENYMHRIGRTGRADHKGNAIAFFTPKEEEFKEKIEVLMSVKISVKQIPEEVKVSELLIDDEIPKLVVKNVVVKTPKQEESGAAFHDKKAKNLKTRIKVTRANQMKKKYKKPKTRGQKRK